MKKLLLLMLLPSLVWAQGFQVKKPKKFDQPPGTIERVSKRSEYGKVFEFDSIGSGRFMTIASAGQMHYQDSIGAFQEYNYEVEDTTGTYDRVVRIGRFELAYSTTNPGRMKYTRKKAFIEFIPSFDTTEVEIMLRIMPNGVKSEYTIIDESRNRLTWEYDASASFEAQIGAKGKGKLKDNQEIKRGELLDFTAVDAVGNPVELTATYINDSLIVQLDTIGAVYPITVDPTVQDTALPTKSATKWLSAVSEVWNIARIQINATNADRYGLYDATYKYLGRGFWSFPLTAFDSTNRIDSVRFFVQSGTLTGSPSAMIAEGTFIGPVDHGWFNDFTGWVADSVPFGLTLFSDDSTKFIVSETTYDLLFNAAGRAAVRSRAAIKDTLRVAMLMMEDYLNIEVVGSRHGDNIPMPYLAIYSTVISPPGLTTAPSDTLYGLAVMAATIDSIGGDSCTIVGFEYNLAGDTVTVADTGKFGVGEFSKTTGSLLLNQTYYFKGFATNRAGTSYSPVGSFVVDTTGVGGGEVIRVDGRQVNIVR